MESNSKGAHGLASCAVAAGAPPGLAGHAAVVRIVGHAAAVAELAARRAVPAELILLALLAYLNAHLSRGSDRWKPPADAVGRLVVISRCCPYTLAWFRILILLLGVGALHFLRVRARAGCVCGRGASCANVSVRVKGR